MGDFCSLFSFSLFFKIQDFLTYYQLTSADTVQWEKRGNIVIKSIDDLC